MNRTRVKKSLFGLPIAVKAGMGYLVGSILLRGITFLTTPIFTRLMLPDAYGEYTVYLSYESFLAIFILLGTSGSIRRAKIDFESRFDDYISNISALVTINFMIVIIVFNVLYSLGFHLFGYNRILLNILVVHCYFDNLIHIYTVQLSAGYQYKMYLLISFISSITNILISILLIKTIFVKETEYGRIWGTFLSLLIIAVYMIVITIKKSHHFFEKDIWIYAIQYSVPLMIHSISLTVLSQFDRIMISEIVGYSEAGIYSLIYSFGSMMSLVWGALDTSWSQWVFDKLALNDTKAVKKVGNKYVMMMLILVFGAMLVMPEIIRFMVDKNYYSGIALFAPVCSGVFLNFLYTFYVQVENFNKKTQYVAVGTLCAGVLNIVLNMIFIKACGYEAAAYTTIASYFVLLVFHCFIVRKVIKVEVYNDMKMLCIGIMVILGGILINSILELLIVRWFMAVILGVCALYYIKRLVKEIVYNG